jgi:hypothetical protein
MDPHQAAQLASEAEAAGASAREVLFSRDLMGEMWPSLDAPTKLALRSVCTTMRRHVDAAIEVVASPRAWFSRRPVDRTSAGFSAAELTAALARWPSVRDLTLLGVIDASDVQPLATASLAGLTSLTVRQVRMAFCARRMARAHSSLPPMLVPH